MTVTNNTYYIKQQTNITSPNGTASHTAQPAVPTAPKTYRRLIAAIASLAFFVASTVAAAFLNDATHSFINGFVPLDAWTHQLAEIFTTPHAPASDLVPQPYAAPPPLPKPKSSNTSPITQTPKPIPAPLPAPHPTASFSYPPTLYQTKQAKLVHQLNALLTLSSSHTCTITLEQHGTPQSRYTLNANGSRVHIPLDGGYVTVQRVDHDCSLGFNCSCTLAISGQYETVPP